MKHVYMKVKGRLWWVPMVLGMIIWAVILTMFVVSLSGCYTKKTALRQVAKAHNTYPEVPAKFCAEMYDPTDSVHVVKEYIQGEDVVWLDTIVEYHEEHTSDTVFATKYITKTVKVTDTVRDTKYIQQENKALIKLRDIELRACNDALLKVTDSRDDWRMWALIGWGVIALYFIIKVIKRYLKR